MLKKIKNNFLIKNINKTKITIKQIKNLIIKITIRILLFRYN